MDEGANEQPEFMAMRIDPHADTGIKLQRVATLTIGNRDSRL